MESKTYNLLAFNQTITAPKTQEYLESLLHERKGAFVNNITALVANNTSLQSCAPFTLMFAALKATGLDLPLDPSLGMAYVIPYKNNRTGETVAQFQIGYKGFYQLAVRSGQYRRINTSDVREGELVRRDRLTGDFEFNFIEDDDVRLKTPIIGYVSYFSLFNGMESTLYMSKKEVEEHAKRYSQTYRAKDNRSSKWVTDFDAMALKTVLKLNLSKNGVLSVELRDAIKADQSVMREEGNYEYDDNERSIEDEQRAAEVAQKFADYEVVDEEQANK